MKKILGLMLALVLSLSLVACGGDSKESGTGGAVTTPQAAPVQPAPAPTPAAPVQAEEPTFTPEQQKFAEEFMAIAEEFDKIGDRINASPELLEDAELVQSMNELADEIIALDEFFGSPETLTPEVMTELQVAFDAVNEFIALAQTELEAIGK